MSVRNKEAPPAQEYEVEQILLEKAVYKAVFPGENQHSTKWEQNTANPFYLQTNQPWIDARQLNTGMWNVGIFRAGLWYLTTLYKGFEHPRILVSMEVLALIISDTEGDYIMNLSELNAIVNVEMPAI